MSRERKNYTPEEKVAILKRHLVDKVSVDRGSQLRRHLHRRHYSGGSANTWKKPTPSPRQAMHDFAECRQLRVAAAHRRFCSETRSARPAELPCPALTT